MKPAQSVSALHAGISFMKHNNLMRQLGGVKVELRLAFSASSTNVEVAAYTQSVSQDLDSLLTQS